MTRTNFFALIVMCCLGIALHQGCAYQGYVSNPTNNPIPSEQYQFPVDGGGLPARCKKSNFYSVIRTYCDDMATRAHWAELHRQRELDALKALCKHCPISYIEQLAGYTAFVNIQPADFLEAILSSLHAQNLDVLAGNREIGLLATDWRALPDKAVGLSKWRVQQSLVVDFRVAKGYGSSWNRPTIYLNVTCYQKEKSPNGGWSTERRLNDESCKQTEKAIFKAILQAGGQLK